MSTPASSSGDLQRLTRRLQVTAYVSGGVVVFSLLSVFTPGAPDAALFFVLLFYPSLFVLMVSSIGTVVGRLLLAARRDEQPVGQGGSGQDWYQ